MSKRKCKFNQNLQNHYKMFKTTDNENEAYCPTCNLTLNISFKGKTALDQHIESENHTKNIGAENISNKLEKYFVKKDSPIERKISAAELTLSYHNVMHHFSFRSSDCTTKLNSVIFNDSQIATRVTLARTKMEAIIKGILGPFTYIEAIKDIQNVPFIGALTDGSNHKDIKLFPVLIQYFNQEHNGVEHKLVELSSLPDERAATITSLLVEVMKKANCLEKLVAFGGDNCNTNFGGSKHIGSNNVYNLLKTNKKHIEGSGCPAHIVNNCIQHAVDCLPVDIEHILFKIYGHFSIYTVRVETLKEFCSFVELNYKQILSHSKTRWLSLYPVINRTLQMYDALKSYFLSIDRPPMILKSFFANPLNEAYLMFVHSLAHSFHASILKMEIRTNSVVETISILEEVNDLLKIRIETKFLPLNVISILKKNDCEINECEKLKEECLQVYSNAIAYLKKWTEQFSPFKVFNWMLLSKIPQWEQIVETIEYLKERDISIDDSKCLNQFVNLRRFVENNSADNRSSVNEKWLGFFKSLNNAEKYSEFLTICQYMFAIPAHNATVERIFSLIEAQWTDERNRMSVDTVKNLAMVKFNFNGQSCSEFYINMSKNIDVLKTVGQNEKYGFNNKT